VLLGANEAEATRKGREQPRERHVRAPETPAPLRVPVDCSGLLVSR
jgi:hypothetical protein